MVDVVTVSPSCAVTTRASPPTSSFAPTQSESRIAILNSVSLGVKTASGLSGSKIHLARAIRTVLHLVRSPSFSIPSLDGPNN